MICNADFSRQQLSQVVSGGVLRRVVAWVALIWALVISTQISAVELDRVVLVVNDQAVTAKEYVSLALLQQPDAEALSAQPVLGTDITEEIVNDLLLLSRADEVGFSHEADATQIDTAIDRLAAQNRMGRKALLTQLAARGVDLDIFRQNLRNRLLIESLVQQLVVPRVNVSPSEIQALVKSNPALSAPEAAQEYELQHLLVPVKRGASQTELTALQQAAEQAREALQLGADVAVLLRENPWLVSSGDNDGSLGWKNIRQLPGIFVAALKDLAVGEVSSVVQSPNGLHILKLLNRRGGETAAQEYKVRHILLTVSDSASGADVEQMIQAVRERLLGGENFASVAASVSEDPGSRVRGGDLGWIDPATMVPAFSSAVKSLAEGELSQPVRSRFGYHLILVEGKRQASGKMGAAERAAQQQIFARKVDEELQDLLNDLRQVAHIEVVE